jgi:hypothetical protein
MTYESMAAAMALGGEIELHGRYADRVHPVHQLLPIVVLDPGWAPASHRRCSKVSSRSLPPQSSATCSAHMLVSEFPLHARVEVVGVRRRTEPLTRVTVATLVGVPGVVAHVRVR